MTATLANYAGRVSDSGEGRWTIAAAIDEAVPAPVLSAALYRALQLARRRRVCRPGVVGDAARVRRAPGKACHAVMNPVTTAVPCSDALVFFGATGDLARKQIFPALQSMIRHEALDLPIIGVARSARNVDELRARARESLEEHGGVDAAAFAKLSARLQYIGGDYGDAVDIRTVAPGAR